MYCNENILQHIEIEEYEEDMPRWMYHCDDVEGADFDVGPALCTDLELEENLDIDLDKFNEACDRVGNERISENDDQIKEEEHN